MDANGARQKIRALIAKREKEMDKAISGDAVMVSTDERPKPDDIKLPMTDAETRATEEYVVIKQMIKDDPKLTEKKLLALLEKRAEPFDTLSREISDCALQMIFRKVHSKDSKKSGGKRNKEDDKASVAMLVEDFLSQHDKEYKLRFWREGWYEYLPKRGYVKVSESEIMGRLAEFLAHHADYCDAGRHKPIVMEMLFRMQSPRVCGIPECVDQPAVLYRNENGHLTGVDAMNTYCFNGMQVDILREAQCIAGFEKKRYPPMDVDENFWSLDKVDYDYVTEHEGKMPIWQKFLNETLSVEDQVALQEMFGICVSDETRFERFWFLEGNGGVGKGVTSHVLEALVGTHNVCNVFIDKLEDDFLTGALTRCKVNIMGDMPEYGYGSLVKAEGYLKKYTEIGGKMDVNEKYQNIERNVSLRARFVFTTNHLPGFVDRSSGIWRRMIIIPYPEQEVPDEKKDVHLTEKIIRNELPYIMAWAVEGLANVLARGYPFESDAGRDKKNELRENGNHEKQFLEDKRISGGSNKLGVDDVYSDYKDWMRENGYRPTAKNKFLARIVKLIPGIKISRDSYLGKNCQCFIGVDSEDSFVLE